MTREKMGKGIIVVVGEKRCISKKVNTCGEIIRVAAGVREMIQENPVISTISHLSIQLWIFFALEFYVTLT